MGPILKDADRLNAKFALMQKQLAGVEAERLDKLRRGGRDERGFAQDIASAGRYRTAAIKAMSATEQFTEALQKQDLTGKQALKNRKQFNEVLKEQYRLQRMSVMEWSTDARGRISADYFIPKDAPDAMRSFGGITKAAAQQQIRFGEAANMARMRVGLMSEVVRSAGLNMVNLGKNTQWAGRQMMVGISMPVGLLAAGAGALAYQTEKELTRIARVYDTTTGHIKSEQNAVKEASMQTAKEMAAGWGMAAKETLDITAQLAATGQVGVKLQQDTAAVAELSVMGELDRQDAIKAAITLNSVFGESLYSLGDMYKYVNQLENETVVSSQDMVTAIPKLAGVVKGLGGDITDIGALMAAARAAGIPAAEAANTLKSVSFRNVAPTNKAVDTFERLTNINYQGLIDLTQGDVIPMIIKLQQAMSGLSKVERIQAVRDLQGLWQGSKALNIMNAIWDPDTGEQDEQFARAVKVGADGAASWREVWDREAEVLQNSLPNRFKQAVEAIKFELAEMGKPFLEAAVTIIGGITKIVKAFNGMDEGTKRAIMWGVAIAAIIGPIVMVSGVFLNLLGTMVKLSGSTGMMISRFKAVNAEQRVQGLLSKASAGAYLTQAESAIVLSTQLNSVGMALDRIAPKANAASAALAGVTGGASATAGKKFAAVSAVRHGLPVGGVYQSRTGQAMAVMPKNHRGSRSALPEQVQRARSMAHSQALLINGQKDLTKHTERHTKALGGSTSAIAGAAGMMGLLVGGTNKWVMYTSTALLMYPLFVPLIAKITASLQLMALTMMRVAGFGAAAAKMGPIFAKIAASAGPVGIAVGVIAAGVGLLMYRARKAREEFEKIANAGDSMVEVMGIEPLKPGEYIDESGQKQKNAIALAEEFKEKNKEATKSLQDLFVASQKAGGSTEELMQKANEIGLNVYNATGDALKAREAVQAALYAAGAVELAVNVRTYFDSDIFREKILRDATNALGDRALELPFIGVLADGEMKADLKESAEGMAESYNKALSGSMDPKDFLKQVETNAKSFTSKMDKVIGQSLKQKGGWDKNELDLFEKFKVDPNNVASIRQAMIANDDFRNSISYATPQLEHLKDGLGGTIDAYRYYSIQFAKQTGLDKNALVNGYDLVGMNKYLSGSMTVLNQSQKSVQASAEGAEDGIEGVGDASENAAADALAAATSLDRLNQAQKQAMEGAWGKLLDFAADQYDDQLQSEMDSIKATGQATADQTQREQEEAEAAADRARDAFDDRWKETMDNHKKSWEERVEVEKEAFDARTKGVEDALEAEREAEKVRQSIFEAEKTRLQRMADLYTKNIDFSAALNSGDLDEAARIGANTAATVGGWAIDDAGQDTGNAHERRIKALEASKEAINEEKDARLKAIEEIREAEERDLEHRKEIEQEALKASEEATQKRFEDRKKKEEAATDHAEQHAQKRHEASKRALEMDLAALQAFIPRNAQELRDHIAEIQATYEKHGGTINTKSDEWSRMINMAITTSAEESKRSLQNDIDWAKFGGQAATDFIHGAFGKSVADFQAMFGTGAAGLAAGTKAPVTVATPAQGSHQDMKTVNRNAAIDFSNGQRQRETGVQRHAGGRVNMQAGSRKGYPKSASRFPSEVDTRLQVGEYVMQKKAVQQYGPDFMSSINEGKLPALHTGGQVYTPNGNVGMAGVAAAVLSGILQTVMAAGINNMNNQALAMNSEGGPGVFGGVEGTFERGKRKWPTAMARRISANTAAARSFIAQMWPGTRNGGDPGLDRQDPSSDHGRGKALDIFPGGTRLGKYAQGPAVQEGWDLANYFVQNPDEFGTKYVIWQKKINSGGGWRDYTRYGANPGPTLGHYDHVHLSVLHGGGLTGEGQPGIKLPQNKLLDIGVKPESSMVAGLRNGGYTLNDGYAKLHAREAVLTAPLTQKFEQGVNNFASGGGNQYTVTVDLRGALVREDIDIEGAVEKALQKTNSKLGIKRKIN